MIDLDDTNVAAVATEPQPLTSPHGQTWWSVEVVEGAPPPPRADPFDWYWVPVEGGRAYCFRRLATAQEFTRQLEEALNAIEPAT